MIISNLFKDIEDRIDTVYEIEAIYNTGVFVLKFEYENKTIVDFLVGIKMK